MRHYTIYILMAIFAMASCQVEELPPHEGECALMLDLTRVGVEYTTTRGIDNDLAIKIVDSIGNVYAQYSAGNIPPKIVLEPGKFTLHAFTENQDSWAGENDGRGGPCYYGTYQVQMEYDRVCYVNMQVPMTNYAVTLSLPELFDVLFLSYTYSLKSGSREITIKEGEKAYFSPEDGGFTYQLSATNTDNTTHHTSPLTYKKVEAGNLYNMTYYYDTEDNSGGLDIEITDNTEKEDITVPL